MLLRYLKEKITLGVRGTALKIINLMIDEKEKSIGCKPLTECKESACDVLAEVIQTVIDYKKYQKLNKQSKDEVRKLIARSLYDKIHGNTYYRSNGDTNWEVLLIDNRYVISETRECILEAIKNNYLQILSVNFFLRQVPKLKQQNIIEARKNARMLYQAKYNKYNTSFNQFPDEICETIYCLSVPSLKPVEAKQLFTSFFARPCASQNYLKVVKRKQSESANPQFEIVTGRIKDL